MVVDDLNGVALRATNMSWADEKCSVERMLEQARAGDGKFARRRKEGDGG